MDNSSESSGSNPSTTLSTPGSSSDAAPLNMSLDILERYLDDVLCSLSDKGLRCKLLDSGMKLRDVVQPVASDFSKLFEGISEGAKNIWDQKSSSSKISSEAQSAAFEAVKGVGNIQLAGVGLLAIATVLERIDKISSNDRDCMDLLKVMLDLAKFLKQLKDMNADSHKEISEKMTEALHLIVTGAILCRSFVGYKKLLKFLFTAKLRDELVYMRRKVDTVIGQLSLQMQVKIASFYMSRQPPYCVVAGGIPSEQSTGDNEIVHSDEMENALKTEINPTDADIDLRTQEFQLEKPCCIEDVLSNHSSSVVNVQPTKILSLKFLRLPRYLKKLTARKIQGWHKRGRAVFEIRLYKSQLSSFNGFGALPIHFTVDELAKATWHFRHKVQQDSSFVSYRGILPNGRQVMVKVSDYNQREMLNELACELKLCHRNILKLFGSCITEKKLMLVYDYMPYRNLSDILFEDRAQSQVLDWPRRSKIILGVTRALVYLHEGVDEHVYCAHRDIKPQNILLDDNFNAKITGFGLAKISAYDDDCPDWECAGTRGYLAPEYVSRGSLMNYKVDIYSFGITVLEVVSGRKALDFSQGEDDFWVVQKAVRLSKEDRLIELIDPLLLDPLGFNSSSILRTIRTALWCVETDPEIRPSASRVLAMLSTEEEIPIPPDNSLCINTYSSTTDGSCSNSPIAADEGQHSGIFDGEVGEIEEFGHV